MASYAVPITVHIHCYIMIVFESNDVIVIAITNYTKVFVTESDD